MNRKLLLIGLAALFSVPVTTVASDRSMSGSGAQDSSSKPMSISEALAESDRDEDEVNPGTATLSLTDLSEAAASKRASDRYRCPMLGCTHTAVKVTDISQHCTNVHNVRFGCPFCKNNYKHYSAIAQHLIKHGLPQKDPKARWYSESEFFMRASNPSKNPADAILIAPLLVPRDQKRTAARQKPIASAGKRVRMLDTNPQMSGTMAELMAATSGPSQLQQSVAPPAQAPQPQAVMPNLPLAIALSAMTAQQQLAAQQEQDLQALAHYRLFLQQEALRQAYERQQQEELLRKAALAEQALIQQEAMRLIMMIASAQAQKQAVLPQAQAPAAQPQPVQAAISSARVKFSMRPTFKCNICGRIALENFANAQDHQRSAHPDKPDYAISALTDDGQWEQISEKPKPKTKKS